METEVTPLAGRSLTLEQWAALAEDEAGEFVDGRIVEDEEVGFLHDLVAAFFIGLLRAWCSPQGGLVGASDTRFGVNRTRGRKPDVSVYFAGRRPPANGLVELPPDIMVEIVSPRRRDARRDRVEKTAEYAAFGVHYYWIVDPQARTLEIFELGVDGRYALAMSVAEGLVSGVPGCPGLSIDLDGLWAEADRLEA